MRSISIFFSILFGALVGNAMFVEASASEGYARAVQSATESPQPGQSFVPLKEGLPLPWPFPWAEKCPIDWSAIQGRYSMMESQNRQELEIALVLSTPFGQRLVRVSTFLSDGSIHSTGFVLMNGNERSVSVELVSSNPLEAQVQATLKMHFDSELGHCETAHLVPILTLKPYPHAPEDQIRYRLIKHLPHSREPHP